MGRGMRCAALQDGLAALRVDMEVERMYTYVPPSAELAAAVAAVSSRSWQPRHMQLRHVHASHAVLRHTAPLDEPCMHPCRTCRSLMLYEALAFAWYRPREPCRCCAYSVARML